jgi:hypothetical protein
MATAAIQGLATRAAFEPGLRTALAPAAAFGILSWLGGEMVRRIVHESIGRIANQPTIPLTSNPTPTSAPQAPGR